MECTSAFVAVASLCVCVCVLCLILIFSYKIVANSYQQHNCTIPHPRYLFYPEVATNAHLLATYTNVLHVLSHSSSSAAAASNKPTNSSLFHQHESHQQCLIDTVDYLSLEWKVYQIETPTKKKQVQNKQLMYFVTN